MEQNFKNKYVVILIATVVFSIIFLFLGGFGLRGYGIMPVMGNIMGIMSSGMGIIGGGFGMGFGLIFMLLFFGLIVWLAITLINSVVKYNNNDGNNKKVKHHKKEVNDSNNTDGNDDDSDALNILKKRYASGEITKKEYEEIKKELVKQRQSDKDKKN